jgi:hypothetical protein
MESLETQQRAISLGKQLVKALNRDGNADTISRWMAHYIAELITIAENAPAADKERAREKCFESIMSLWKHRAFFPNGRRPFEEFEPVLIALARLSPEESRSYYHRLSSPRENGKESEPDHVQQLIEIIFAIDSATRVLITEMLKEATEEATNENTKSLLKDAASFSPSLDIKALDILFQESENAPKDLTSDNARRIIIQDRIAKLDSFCELALQVRKKLNGQLGMS